MYFKPCRKKQQFYHKLNERKCHLLLDVREVGESTADICSRHTLLLLVMTHPSPAIAD